MFCRHEYMRTVTGTGEAGSGSLDLEAQRAVTAICQSSQCSELLSRTTQSALQPHIRPLGRL